MGDFREQLLKAGLVSAEQAKKVEDETKKPKAPPRPGPKGGPGGRRDERPRDERPNEERAEAQERAPLSKEESLRLLKLAQAGKVDGKTRGNRRFYFVSRGGSVPYLELSEEAVRDLEQGAIAIAESERGEAWLVSRDCAAKLREADPAWVRSLG